MPGGGAVASARPMFKLGITMNRIAIITTINRIAIITTINIIGIITTINIITANFQTKNLDVWNLSQANA